MRYIMQKLEIAWNKKIFQFFGHELYNCLFELKPMNKQKNRMLYTIMLKV